MAGLVKLPLDGSVVQYCAWLFAQPTVTPAPPATPDAVPLTKPRPDGATEPAKPKLYMKLMSGTPGADVPLTISAYGPCSTPSRCGSVSLEPDRKSVV